MLWIKFCNRQNTIKTHRERICSLHFKQEDFERNLKFEMGFSNRATQKLKKGAFPTIDASEAEEEATKFVEESTTSVEETKIFVEDTTKLPEEPKIVKTSTNQDSLQIYTRNLEVKMDALRQENDMLKVQKSQDEITIKNLSQKVQKFNFTKIYMQKALRRLFTEGQTKKIINGGKRQNFTEADTVNRALFHKCQGLQIADEKKFFHLQRWSQKLDVSKTESFD